MYDSHDEINQQAAEEEAYAYERDWIAGRIPRPLAIQDIPAEGTE